MSYISAIFIILIHTTITSSFQSNISILIKEALLIKKYTSIVPQHTTSSSTRFTQRRRISYHRSVVKTTMAPKENHTFDYNDGIDYQEGDIDIHSEDIESVLYQPTRDNKRLPKVSNTQFLLTTLVGVPVWATILLPITLVYQIAKSILPSTLLSSSALGSEASSSSCLTQDNNHDTRLENDERFEIIPFEQRQYDVVLLGCTGYTGTLAAHYMAKTYGCNGKVKWALAGRSLSKLQNLSNALSTKYNLTSSNIPSIILVDTSNRSTIHNLAQNTRVVLSTAGPFCKYGSNVVEFCVKYGTSYVDITGEVDWNKDMIMKWDTLAQKNKCKIVSLCGHDSIPWDLSVWKLNNLLQNRIHPSEDLVKVHIFDEINGGVSGGTVDTATHLIEGKYDAQRYDFDPYLRTQTGAKSNNKTKNASPIFISKYPDKSDKWVGPFVMSNVNAEVIKRTRALFDKPVSPLTYKEFQVHNGFKEAAVQNMAMLIGVTALLNPWSGSFLKRHILPKPGEGPSEMVLRNGYMLLYAKGEGSQGSIVESALYYPRDGGYAETARMVVESSLCLALDVDKLPIPKNKGGFFSPAVAMGDVLLERLCRTGCKFASRVVPPSGIRSKL